MYYIGEGRRWKKRSHEYSDDFAWCYGCGRLNENGHHFRTGWQGDTTITIYKPLPEHTALPGFVYGGLIASLIDCHGTGLASLALQQKNVEQEGGNSEPPRFVTASLKVDFLKPTPHGVPLKAIGVVEEVILRSGKSIQKYLLKKLFAQREKSLRLLCPQRLSKNRIILNFGIIV
ncbi:hypothetical protein GCM10007199_42840 [Fictibacillus barbaricus]|nr:hypothetical protein GCM10007199_42840 [Fictibacillus barbaricus]